MRATLRITWLLLSLSFLCQSVCSNQDVQGETSVSKNVSVTDAPVVTTTAVQQVVPTGASTSKAALTTASSKAETGATVAAVTDGASKTKDSTQASTPAKPTDAPTTQAVTAAAKPTDAPGPNQSQAPQVTNIPSAPPTLITGAGPSVVNHTSPGAAVPSLPKTQTPAAPVHSSNTSVVTSNAATAHVPQASVPSKTSGTETPVRTPGHTATVGATNIPKVSTDALTTRQQSAAQTTVTSKVTQENNKGTTQKVTGTVTSHVQTASRAPEPAGNTGAPSTPSAVTGAGLPAAETSGTKAGTMSPQTTSTSTSSTTAALPKTFSYSLNNGHEKEEEKELVEVCRRLMVNFKDGNCTLKWRHHNGKIQFDCVELNGKVKTSLASQYYEEITKKPTDNKTLIAILASCGALLIMIVILAVCASHHRKPYNENQQHLTEELHTVENGYHDNPTLEVMEVQPEMQEKKVALNGEFNDSWIVPIDNLLKEDIPDEEDTHL